MSLEPPRTFLAWVRSQKLPPSRNLSRLSSRLTQCLRVGQLDSSWQQTVWLDSRKDFPSVCVVM